MSTGTLRFCFLLTIIFCLNLLSSSRALADPPSDQKNPPGPTMKMLPGEVDLSSAASQSAMQSGKENLDNKRYWSAYSDFQRAVQQNPGDQEAYYYLGISCENLKQHDNAKEAYRACYSINPFSSIGQKARKALLDVSDHIEALKHRAIDTPEIISKSATTIQKQASELQGRKIQDGERTANWRIQQGRFYYNQGDPLYRNNGFGHFPGPGGGSAFGGGYATMPDLLYRDPTRDVSNTQFLNRSHILYDSQTQAARARGEATKQAIGIQDFSNGLIERVGRKTPDGTPALRGLGTNLYVQYYRSMDEEDELPPPPDAPLELKAKQMLYTDQRSKGNPSGMDK